MSLAGRWKEKVETNVVTIFYNKFLKPPLKCYHHRRCARFLFKPIKKLHLKLSLLNRGFYSKSVALLKMKTFWKIKETVHLSTSCQPNHVIKRLSIFIVETFLMTLIKLLSVYVTLFKTNWFEREKNFQHFFFFFFVNVPHYKHTWSEQKNFFLNNSAPSLDYHMY